MITQENTSLWQCKRPRVPPSHTFFFIPNTKAHQTEADLLLLSARLLLSVLIHVCIYVQEKASTGYQYFTCLHEISFKEADKVCGAFIVAVREGGVGFSVMRLVTVERKLRYVWYDTFCKVSHYIGLASNNMCVRVCVCLWPQSLRACMQWSEVRGDVAKRSLSMPRAGVHALWFCSHKRVLLSGQLRFCSLHLKASTSSLAERGSGSTTLFLPRWQDIELMIDRIRNRHLVWWVANLTQAHTQAYEVKRS